MLSLSSDNYYNKNQGYLKNLNVFDYKSFISFFSMYMFLKKFLELLSRLKVNGSIFMQLR